MKELGSILYAFLGFKCFPWVRTQPRKRSPIHWRITEYPRPILSCVWISRRQGSKSTKGRSWQESWPAVPWRHQCQVQSEVGLRGQWDDQGQRGHWDLRFCIVMNVPPVLQEAWLCGCWDGSLPFFTLPSILTITPYHQINLSPLNPRESNTGSYFLSRIWGLADKSVSP